MKTPTQEETEARIAAYIRHLETVNPTMTDEARAACRFIAGRIEDKAHRLPFPGNP